MRGFYRTVLHPFPVLHATHGMQRRHEKKRMTIPLLGFDLVLTRGLRAAVQSGRAHGRTLAFPPIWETGCRVLKYHCGAGSGTHDASPCRPCTRRGGESLPSARTPALAQQGREHAEQSRATRFSRPQPPIIPAPRPCHLCGWTERIPGAPGKKTTVWKLGLLGAAAATLTWESRGVGLGLARTCRCPYS